MNDIRDVSSLTMPPYRNDYFGATMVMSNAGAPMGMERTLRTTDLSVRNVVQAINTTVRPHGAATLEYSGDTQSTTYRGQTYELAEITGELRITDQGNINDLNRRLAKFVTANLSKDNPQSANETIIALVSGFRDDARYVNVAAHDVFSALSFLISDVNNWNGIHSDIKIPDWAVPFIHDHEKEFTRCIKDIHNQLKGNYHTRHFAKKTAHMSNAAYDAALAKEFSKVQNDLMLISGDQYLQTSFSGESGNNIVKQIFAYHDEVLYQILEKTCNLIIATPTGNNIKSLSKDDVYATLCADRYYKAFHRRSCKLKNDLLVCDVFNSTISPGNVSRITQHRPWSYWGAPKTTFNPEFIKLSGRLFMNVYSCPVPDKFLDKFFEGEKL